MTGDGCRICETTLEDYGVGLNFQLSFDVVDGPERNILMDLLTKRRIRIKATSDGKGVMIYSAYDEGIE